MPHKFLPHNTASHPKGHNLYSHQHEHLISHLILSSLTADTGWSRGNARFSYKNNFVYFQHKKVLITPKKRYFNAFLKYIPNYVWKIMSVRWRPSCRTHIQSLYSKSCVARSNIFFCGKAANFWRMENFSFSIVRGLFVYTIHLRYPHKKSRKSIDQGNVGPKNIAETGDHM